MELESRLRYKTGVKLDAEQAADYLRVSYFTLVRYLNRGDVPGKKKGKSWEIDKERLDKKFYPRGEYPKDDYTGLGDQIFDLPELAEYLGVSIHKIYDGWMTTRKPVRGQIPVAKIGGSYKARKELVDRLFDPWKLKREDFSEEGDEIWDINGLADYLGIDDPLSLYKHIHNISDGKKILEGKIPGTCIGGRWRFKKWVVDLASQEAT
ncbi:MAG: helix-turn-helix domain-containing protein [Nanoarchaeota archaeon]|nr:helix-turn-helix domain-containing protein [Nanoarchaeota archaeon]